MKTIVDLTSQEGQELAAGSQTSCESSFKVIGDGNPCLLPNLEHAQTLSLKLQSSSPLCMLQRLNFCVFFMSLPENSIVALFLNEKYVTHRDTHLQTIQVLNLSNINLHIPICFTRDDSQSNPTNSPDLVTHYNHQRSMISPEVQFSVSLSFFRDSSSREEGEATL